MSSSTVPLRKLGKDGPKVPAMGFGLSVMSPVYGTPPSEEECFRILDRALELGATFWDTANSYLDNEKLVGKWFKRTGKRNEIFLSSKFGIDMDGLQFKGVNSSAEHCKRSCEASLERLGIDSIDLYYVHRINPNTPIEETMRALAELKAQGKIKHIGLCELSSTTLRRAYKIAPIAAIQMEYSVFVRDIEHASGTDLLATCRELGVTVVCYSPLGRGLLTGAFTTRESVMGANDFRATHFPWFSEENLDANVKLVNQFKALAEKKGCSASQLAIAWILKQGEDMIPNPGTKKMKYLEEDWAALDVNLTDEEEAEVRKFVEGAEVAGHRSMPMSKAFAYVTTKEEA
ncbi:MAG: hypothetical protein Q9227_008706 [Pyrenula ochraceoflavens]